MPGVIDTSVTFATDQVVTSDNLNNILDQSFFNSDAVSGTATLEVLSGKLRVKTAGITSNELASNAVTTAKITDSSVSTAKIADLGVTTAKINDSAVTTAKIADDAVTIAKIAHSAGTFPVQVKQVVKTDTQTIAGTASAFADVSGLSISITRVAGASKIRIQASIANASDDASHGLGFRLVRDDSTNVGIGDAAGNRLRVTATGSFPGAHQSEPCSIDFIDDVSGLPNESFTYKIQAKMYSVRNGYINRSNNDTDSSDFGFRPISTLTVTELA